MKIHGKVMEKWMLCKRRFRTWKPSDVNPRVTVTLPGCQMFFFPRKSGEALFSGVIYESHHYPLIIPINKGLMLFLGGKQWQPGAVFFGSLRFP